MSDEEDIFEQALRIGQPQERTEFLDRACADQPQLRQQVEKLLQAHEQTSGILESPVVPVIDAPASEQPGALVGNYKLLEQIGEGGMGVVYMAEQLRPVKRRVALKILKPGLDTRQVIARFEAERQALAMMDHPNIARVFDAGVTETGRPYFAMELVRGIPITQFCDQDRLTPRQRLELFVQVCQAVQHAHQKGIIHRDLKPTNVLVTLADDGKPVSKIIDFGIAKATGGHRLVDQTLFTEFRQLIGTPLYMSPEQAERSAVQDVDTRSDVYSLGVLLYELLTGTTPFDKNRLATAAYDEVRRIIREEEPPRPSTRLSTLGQTLTSISAQRQTDPKKLSQTVRGELDWIVMKALEKDRGRRYETANGLARDIERYMADEPVEAGPPSRRYRLRKLARRHRVPLQVASAFVLLLVAATAVSMWQAVRATKAKAAAVLEKKRADEQTAIAKAVNDFLNENVLGQASVYNQDAKDAAPDLDLKVRDALDRAAASIGERFKDQPLVEAAIRHTIGDAYFDLNELDKAEQHLTVALRLRRQRLGNADPDTLQSLGTLAHVYARQNLLDKAESLLAEGLKTSRAAHGERHPATLELLEAMAFTKLQRGDSSAAALLQQVLDGFRVVLGNLDKKTLEACAFLGEVHLGLGQYAEAEGLLKEALNGKAQVLGLAHPSSCFTARALATVYIRQRRYDEAEQVLTKALQATRQTFGPQSGQTLAMLNHLGLIYAGENRLDEAEQITKQELDVSRQRYGEQNLRTLVAMSNLGDIYCTRRQFVEAEKLLVPALQGLRKVEGNGSITFATMNHLVRMYNEQQRFEDLERIASEAIEAAGDIWGREHPETLLDDQVLQSLCGMLDTRAHIYMRLGKSKEADADIEKCIQLANSNNTSAIRTRANWYKLFNRFDEALADRARAIKLQPSDYGSWEELAALHLYLGHEKEYLAARRVLIDRLREQKHTTDHPLKTCLLFPLDTDELKVCMAIADHNNVPTYHEIHFYHSDKGLAEYRARNYEEAIKWLSLGRDEFTALITTHPEARDLSRFNAWDEVRTTDEFVIAMCEHRLGHPEQAREALARARDLLHTYTPSASSGKLKVGSLDWLMVQIIAREAERTVARNEPATTSVTQPSTRCPASPAIPADWPVAVRSRAALHQRLGRFDVALVERTRAFELDPSDRDSWVEAAAVHVYLGHTREYLAARDVTLRRLKEANVDDPLVKSLFANNGDHPLKLCLLAPLDPSDANAVLPIADRLIGPEAPPQNLQWYHFDKGMAEYRLRNFQVALSWLLRDRDELTQSIMKSTPESRERSPYDEIRTTVDFVIAMCEQHLGHPAKAQEAMSRARTQLLTYTPSPSSGLQKVGTFNWLMVQIVAREAEKGILANDPTTMTMPATIPPTTPPAAHAPVPAPRPEDK